MWRSKIYNMKPRIFSAKETAIIKALYQSGKGLRAIAEKVKAGFRSVRKRLVKSGITVRTPTHDGPRRPPVLTIKQGQRAAKTYVAGESLDAVGRDFGVGAEAVRCALRREGVAIRSCTEQLNLNSYSSLSTAHRRLALNDAVFDLPDENGKYWIGYLMADGNVRQHGNRSFVISLTSIDIEHIYKFKDFCGSGHHVYIRQPEAHWHRKFAVIRFASGRMGLALARFGVVPRKSHTAKAIGLENDRDFWRGAIDGDGGIRYTTGSKTHPHLIYPQIYLCGSGALINQFMTYVRRIIPTCRVSQRKQKPKSPVSIWECSFAGKGAVAIIKNLYENCETALDRKLATANEIISAAS